MVEGIRNHVLLNRALLMFSLFFWLIAILLRVCVCAHGIFMDEEKMKTNGLTLVNLLPKSRLKSQYTIFTIISFYLSSSFCCTNDPFLDGVREGDLYNWALLCILECPT